MEEEELDLGSLGLDDIELDAAELAEFGISLADESPTVTDELKALEAMAEASPRSPKVQGNFGMIRALPAEDREADYGIDNVKLTAEDMNDPDLLRELGLLLDAKSATPKVLVQEKPVAKNLEEDGALPLELMLESEDKGELERWAAQEKARAVSFKQAGDQEAARMALRAYKSLRARITELTTVPDELQEALIEDNLNKADYEDPVELKRRVLEAKRAGDMEAARGLMARLMALEAEGSSPRSPPPAITSPSNASKTKQLVQQIAKQAEESLNAAKVHLKTGSKTDASMFMNRRKAFETDLAAIKAAHQAKRPFPAGRQVSLNIPLDLENIDVAEEELKVLITGLNESERPGRRSKESLAASAITSGEYYFKLSLGWSSEQESEVTLPSFKLPTSTPIDIRHTFTGIQRSIKAIKFFEHHKLRLDLYRRESSFLRTKHVLVGSAYFRLSPLLMQPTLEAETIELVDGSRRSVGVQVEVGLRLRRPISPKALAMKTVSWTVFDEFSSGKLFPLSPSQQPVLDEPPSPTNANEESSIQEEVDLIQSYAVLEHEIEQISKNPPTAIAANPPLSLRLLALETKKDAMDLSFQLGQVSFEDYLLTLQSYRDATKRRALEAKREGNMDRARMYMMHLQITEKEIEHASSQTDE